MTNEKTVRYEEFSKAMEEEAMKMRAFEESEKTKLAGVVEIRHTINFGTREITTGINWSAIGTVDAETAMELPKLIAKASELANNFKYNGYTVVY